MPAILRGAATRATARGTARTGGGWRTKRESATMHARAVVMVLRISRAIGRSPR
jgi:hypothetical protein